MEITDIQIHLTHEERLKAFVSVTFDNCFVVHNMKVVAGEDRIFLCMPSRKTATGEHRDLVHPITRPFRAYLEEKVLKVYREACAADTRKNAEDTFNKPQSVF